MSKIGGMGIPDFVNVTTAGNIQIQTVLFYDFS